MYRAIYLAIGVLVLACCGNGMDRCCLEKDPETRKLIGDGLAAGVEGGDPEDVLKIFEEALKRDPNAIRALWGRGMALVAIGRFEAAHQDGSKIIQLCPDLKEGYFLRAKIFEAQGHTIRYRLALHSAKNAPKGFEDLAMAAMDQQIANNPEDAKLIYRRGRSKAAHGDYKGAVEDYDEYLRLVGKPDNYRIYWDKAVDLEQLGDFEGALKCWETAMEMFPEPEFDTIGFLDRTAALRRKLGDIEGAEADLRKLQEWIRQKDIERIEDIYEQIDAFEEGIRLIDRKLELEAGKGGLNDDLRAEELEIVNRKLEVWGNEHGKPRSDDFVAYRARFEDAICRRYKDIFKRWLALAEYDKASDTVEEFLKRCPDTAPKKAASMKKELFIARRGHCRRQYEKWLELGEYDKAEAAVDEFFRRYPETHPAEIEGMRKFVEEERKKAMQATSKGTSSTGSTSSR